MRLLNSWQSPRRRHIKIGLYDIRYVGKEASELDQQVAFGFDPEAQPDYGMGPKAYALQLMKVQAAIKGVRLSELSRVAGVSSRYLRSVRNGVTNVSLEILQRIEQAIPKLLDQGARERELLQWLQTRCEQDGLREIARELETDPANLSKVLLGKRRPSTVLLEQMRQFYFHKSGTNR